eukprot:10210435-Lingulodinium_polyedra.AAC.1
MACRRRNGQQCSCPLQPLASSGGQAAPKATRSQGSLRRTASRGGERPAAAARCAQRRCC